MNWDQIEGKWKQFAGSAREKWGKLTDRDWQTIAGKKDQLVGRIQERYGIAKEEAERDADAWARKLTNVDVEEERLTNEHGVIGYGLLWLMGIPASVLFLIFLLRGCD